MALSVTFSKLILRFGKVLYPAGYAHVSGGEWGRGAGKGGGSGGSIRDAGGIFGKMEAAREEEYFRKLQSRQLAKLKKHMSEEISHYKRLIQMHKDSIARLESRIQELQSSVPEDDPESKTKPDIDSDTKRG